MLAVKDDIWLSLFWFFLWKYLPFVILKVLKFRTELMQMYLDNTDLLNVAMNMFKFKHKEWSGWHLSGVFFTNVDQIHESISNLKF